ncbi:MAG: hypothetical protein HYX56_03055 [Chloroflexi bacterium]|nr:hypothetical protein [Chloroflexota bacterium]
MAATEISVTARAESRTLVAFEERLRAELADRLQVRTRFAPLGGTRALLVSAGREGRKGLVVDDSASIAERVYLYVHVAAHMALGHNVPLVTIVESAVPDGSDEHRHDQAERLARSIWWRGSRAGELDAGLPGVTRSRVLRALLSRGPSRRILRAVLMAMRALSYRAGVAQRSQGAVVSWLREALCAAAVVNAAPQLATPSGGRASPRSSP